ncbi:hypothetical protein D9613_012826 [Agrocybe pediades]|uniref:Nephrocystin 3-like N-terminal domain-containing protein n=1 Tax=Agrocybe pediades TaxID=84607 RepID=A0A8H4R3J7_9AGAR|nr:hypothetical protein D9613_012826 [Agrocybe pediades]
MTQPDTSVPPPVNISHSIVKDATFIQHNNINQHHYTRSGERPGYMRLLENVAKAALHDSIHVVDPPKCHPNTRVAIIQNIHDWTLGVDAKVGSKPILWLKGGAGAGKSAIARSVAERCSDEGLLLGAFFFGAADPTRNHVGRLVATLSYQISIVLPEFRDMVAAFIEDDPLIFDRSIKTQFSTLIVRPLSAILANRPTASTATPRLIIIDGLDECSAVNSQQDLVLTLQEVTNTTTFIRFLVCSRPESHLNSAFSLFRMTPILHCLFLDDDDYAASDDIRLYLEDTFKQIKEEHVFKNALPDPWPAPEMVDILVDKSSGQFIYAATVIRYVDSPRHRPNQRLDAIFNLRPPFKDLPFTELDALYRLIISKAEDLPAVLDILAFPALYGAYHAEAIEMMLQLEQGSVEVLLADLHSIVTFSWEGVRFLHKSLADFLSEPQRAGDLYRDLFRVQLSHVARVISIFSTHCGQRTRILHSSQIYKPIIQVLSELRKPDNMKADYVSSDILQALQLFPSFEFLKAFIEPLFSSEGPIFIRFYFQYLYCIKDVVLALLLMNWSSDWAAHFVFAYDHLLHDPCYLLPRKLSHVNFITHFQQTDVEAFGHTMLYIIGVATSMDDLYYPYFDDITKISHDLMGNTEKEAIFAKSASFCLALLCDERSASQDAGSIYGIARHDRRKKRDHPWHWRQMVPRPPSLGNRLALIGFRPTLYMDYKLKLTRIRKALRNSIPYRYGDIRLITMREYFEVKSEPVPKSWPWWIKDERPQQWPLYIFLLDLLPHILPLAGWYEPLVDMCRKKCLSSLSQVWPKKSRRARQAIDNYLCRMDSQEGGE